MTTSKINKVLIRPFTYIHDSIGNEATKILCLLCVQVILLAITQSWRSLFNIIATVLGSVGAYYINQKFNKYDIQDYFSLLISIVQGLITGMLVPSTFMPVSVFFITMIVMLVVKHFFGGFSYSWANPCVYIIVILWIVGYKLFPHYMITSDLLTMRNPSQYMIENGLFKIYSQDSSITDALNTSIFSIFKVSVPEGYVSLFWDSQSIIPAFRFNFITILSSLLLFCDDLVKIIIPSLFLFVYILLVRIFGTVLYSGSLMQGDMILALLTSGTLFIAVFVIGWYGTTPISIGGKIAYGIVSGILAFLICGNGTSPVGMAFTVLISNVVSIIIQQYENRRDRIKLIKMLNSSKLMENN